MTSTWASSKASTRSRCPPTFIAKDVDISMSLKQGQQNVHQLLAWWCWHQHEPQGRPAHSQDVHQPLSLMMLTSAWAPRKASTQSRCPPTFITDDVDIGLSLKQGQHIVQMSTNLYHWWCWHQHEPQGRPAHSPDVHHPLSLMMLTSAWASSKASTQSRCPFSAAIKMAVLRPLPVRLTLAPAVTRARTTSKWPQPAAQCSGVSSLLKAERSF